VDFNNLAPMWMPLSPQPPAVTLTFDLQNLIRSSVIKIVQAIPEMSWLTIYECTNRQSNKWMDGTTRQSKNITLSLMLLGGKHITI